MQEARMDYRSNIKFQSTLTYTFFYTMQNGTFALLWWIGGVIDVVKSSFREVCPSLPILLLRATAWTCLESLDVENTSEFT